MNGPLILLLATAAPGAGASASAPGPPAPAVAADADEPVLDAWLSAAEGYRLRTDGSAGDNDVSLLVDGGARALEGRAGLDVSGALFWDVDGKSPGFASIHDDKGAVDIIVDTLELRGAADPLVPRFSIGRLTVDEGLPETLDGAAVAVTPLRVPAAAVTLFGSVGRTVHFYAVDGEGFEDWAASAGTDLLIAQTLKLEADYRALVQDSPSHRFAQSYGAAFYQRIDDVALTKLWARGIDDKLSHVGARTHLAYAPPPPGEARRTPWQIGIDLDGVEQTAPLGEVFESENPLFAVLGKSEPNLRGAVDAWGRADVGVADAGLHLGASGRRVLQGEQGPFNRDSGRVYALAEADDIVLTGPFLSAIVSYDVALGPSEPAVVALGGSAGWRGDSFKASVGTSWDRVKYDYYRDVNELLDVRTVYASLDVRPLAFLRVKADYSLELADRVVHTARVTLVQDLGGGW